MWPTTLYTALGTLRSISATGYSLKEVERHGGYSRTQDEYGGDWAMAQHIEAWETDAAERRERAMQKILDYNREEIEATWAVLTWLKSLSPLPAEKH